MAMARTVMTLSEDMIVEILLRLPVKILARFRCVSKHWRSLISDPQFAKRHFKRASEHTQKILLSTPSTLGFIEIDAPFWDASAVRDLFFRFKQRGRAVKTVGSCNGLVCVALYNHKDFYIWNPSTEAHRKLPDPEVSPDGGTYKYGFGYDSSSGDYKVLVASYVARNPGHFLGSEGKLFSLKGNSWIRIQVLDNHIYLTTQAGILCNSALHWEVLLDEPYNCEMIVAFNLAEEKFVNVPYPPIPIEEYEEEEDIDICFGGLRNLGGRLCCTCYRTNFVELLVMMEYGV